MDEYNNHNNHNNNRNNINNNNYNNNNHNHNHNNHNVQCIPLATSKEHCLTWAAVNGFYSSIN